LYGLRDYDLRCILTLDFHCIGRIKEIIKLPVSKVEVKSNLDTFVNCLHIVLKRYKTSSKSSLHLLHESNLGPNRRNWYSDPLHCIADMLSRGSNASNYLFPHFSHREHYIEMINGRLHSILMALTDDELEQCNLSREVVGDDPPPKKKQRQMLIAPVDNRGTTSNDIELSMKHKTIAATVNDYYSKQYYLCITSANSTNNNASQVLKKMRQLIYCLHYLAQDNIGLIAWCKTSPVQRAEDWASRMLAKSLSLQDLVMQKLREYGIKVHNKGPVFWSTVKTFQENGLLELASNHYT